MFILVPTEAKLLIDIVIALHSSAAFPEMTKTDPISRDYHID
jgi:hypothetical protein